MMLIKNKSGIKGKYKITVCDCKSRAAKIYLKVIKESAGDIKMRLIKKFNEFFAIKVYEFENIVPNAYLNALAENMVTLGGSLPAASELRVSYVAVGTDGTVPVAGNTTLGTEVFRDTVDSQVSNTNEARNTLFVSDTEANGNTLREVGAFAGVASGAADSGLMASHALFSVAITKDNTKTITIEISHTFSDA